MFHVASGLNNNFGCSTDLPDASAAGIDHCEIPASVASDTPAFSSKRKCQVTRRETTYTPDRAHHDITATFATQLKIRRCSESKLNVYSGNSPNRELLGGKGMFLTLIHNTGLAVPPFRCIDTSIVLALEHLQLDVSPLLAMLDDGCEFAHATASLANIRQWITEIASPENPSGHPSANLSEKQQRWLNALSSFIAGPEFYQQIHPLPIADTIRDVHEDLCTSLTKPNSPIIVRSSGVAEDSFGNAQPVSTNLWCMARRISWQPVLKCSLLPTVPLFFPQQPHMEYQLSCNSALNAVLAGSP